MAYEVLLEKNDRILMIGREGTKAEAEQKLIEYIESTEDADFEIWIEED